MKVALILAELEEWKSGRFGGTTAPPLGLACIASYARKYARVAGLEIRLFRELRDLVEYHPALVGISAFTSGFSKVDEIAARVKDELSVPIVLGGGHISALPASLPHTCDVGVIGEGEITFTEILEALDGGSLEPHSLRRIKGIAYRDEGGIISTAPRPVIRNLDEIPFPARELFGNQWRVPDSFEQLITSRGCPYDCAFCSVSATMGRKYRAHSAEYVVREIEHIREARDPKRIKVEDDLFTLDKNRARRIAAGLNERGLNRGIAFNGNTRANLIDGEWCGILRDIGFDVIQMGLESMSDHLLRFLDKKGDTPEGKARAVDLIHEHGFDVACTFIVGIPGETREDILRIYSYIVENMNKFVAAAANPLRVYPGTRVWRYAVDRGFCDEEHLDRILLKDGEDRFRTDRSFIESNYLYLNEAKIPLPEFAAYCEMLNELFFFMPGNWERNRRLRGLETERRRLEGELDRFLNESWKTVLGRKIRNRIAAYTQPLSRM